jgi:hypothetical protein
MGIFSCAQTKPNQTKPNQMSTLVTSPAFGIPFHVVRVTSSGGNLHAFLALDFAINLLL